MGNAPSLLFISYALSSAPQNVIGEISRVLVDIFPDDNIAASPFPKLNATAVSIIYCKRGLGGLGMLLSMLIM